MACHLFGTTITNAGLSDIGIDFNEILFEINIFLFKKTHQKMLSGNCEQFCSGLNVLNDQF